MHRIDAAGYAAGNLFTDGNPSTGTPATVVDAAWLNDIQENLAQLIEAAGIVLSKGDYTQLLKAIVTKGMQGSYFNIGTAGGTADAITGSYTPAITALTNGMTLYVRAAAANATTTPTFTPNSGVIAAKQIVKGAGTALAAGDIAGAGHWIELQYDATLDKWVLLNPANGINSSTAASIQGAFKNLQASATGTGATVSVSADEIALETSGNSYVTRRGLSLSGALTASGANGLDNTAPQSVTISIASPGVVTLNGHGFPANAPVVLSTSGTLPTGLTAGTTYYVVNPTANTFQLSATKGGAAINTSGSQSGTQSVASVLAASSWYSRWIIDNGTTQALLWSSSATNPVLPSGYTAKARCGWDITDGTANRYPLPFSQIGNRITFAPGAGKNLTSFGQLTGGTVGTYGTAMAAVSTASYAPPTARKVSVIVQQTATTNGGIAVSSNSVYGAASGASPGYANMVSYMGVLSAEIPFETQGTIYVAGQGSTATYITGYEENF